MGRHKRPGGPAVLIVCVFLLGSTGCASLGPTNLPMDRFNYNKALARSSNEQLLLNIVRQRYGEPLHWLEVSSMLSQYSLQANAGAGAWWNDLDVWKSPALRAIYGVDNDPSRQTSWDAGVSLKDSPTVSYSPVQGKDFARRLLNPIPISVIAFFAQAGWPVEEVLQCCVARMNGLPNPLGDSPPGSKDGSGTTAFDRALELLCADQKAGAFQGSLEQDPTNGEFYLLMESAEPLTDSHRQLRELLGIDPNAQRIRLTPRGRTTSSDELALQTRSLLGTLQALACFVEVPDDHAQAGTALECNTARPSLESLSVRHSVVPRIDAFVQVQHKGHWFYIAESDVRSKRTFALLTYLYSLQAGDVSGKGPVLTVPASR
jgi:hypothetical protein